MMAYFKSEVAVKPTITRLAIWSFPAMGQEESQTLIDYSGRGTHAT